MMNRLPIIVVGAGGHAKVLIDTLLALEKKIIGIVDRDADKLGMTIQGVPIIGDDAVISNYASDEILLVNGIGSIKDITIRKKIYDEFKKKGYSFFQVIHPSAVIARTVKLGEGVQVMAGALIQAGTIIGENSIINTGAVVDHDCIIAEHVHIAPGAVLSGGVTVSVEAHVGTGAVIIQNIQIGEGSVLGAGSVTVCNIPENVMAYGNPARVIKIIK